MKYSHAILGGTFDRFHAGHHALLKHAFAIASHVTIGLTTDTYVATYKHPMNEENISGVTCPSVSLCSIASFATRKKVLTRWLTDHKYQTRSTIMPIGSMEGGADTMTDIDVIVVSKETATNAGKINDKRVKKGLPRLAVFAIPMVHAEDAKPISATRIRHKEIDISGNLTMPDAMRKELGEPFGTVLADGNTESILRGDHGKIVVTVGDKTTKKLLDNGIVPTLAVVDMQVERQPYMWEKDAWDKLPKTKQTCVSGPGYMSACAVHAIKTWSHGTKPLLLVIDGEEDLLVLPALLHAPIGTIVYYGQPMRGLVRVVVHARVKKRVETLLKHFT